MDERPRSDVSDKYSCQCSNCKCRLSIRNKIKIKVAIAKVAPYAVFVGKGIFISDAAEEAEISLRVAIDIYQWLREVCTAKLLQTQIILGGPGVVVQIDESLFMHKPKIGRKPVQLSNE